ncbi:AMP-binding protein [Pseudaminobacter soli (ex Li et al. 2025)]|uniref:2-acyl-glycerophospho-ethanolamine acyltransferase n=1 Tax=Pseudaminobacter soli (ex Li et al. 2025) TaxID=1295366 RepID=A0A2P7SFV4_9HYPH|nr:AMP-binding protein [Mesorhizobium soli]PSJ61255.1 2-acyl-glycerophospho-ethanolamine acyltransferase [Mesorhizobium soli]
MTLTGTIALCILAAYVAGALWQKVRLGITLHQALLYLPLKLAYRIDDSRMRDARKAEAPVVYVVPHQSRLDPALMLSLLPEDTLHILDEASARSHWLEPWRELARTIVFNAEHVFVSRRLVRVLKGKGRLAVYLPDEVEPDVKAFRLFRAVAHIAHRADAKVVPIFIGGSRNLPFSLTPREKAPRKWFPRLTIAAMEPATISELMARNVTQPARASNALFDRIAEARFCASDPRRSLFLAVRDAALRTGASYPILEDPISGKLSYRKLFIGARLLGLHLASVTAPGEAVGVLLPNSNGLVATLMGLASGSRVAAMINYTAGPAAVTAAVRTAPIRIIVSSRKFIEKANLDDIVAAAEKGSARILWLEDILKQASIMDRIAAALFWRWPVHAQDASKPAIILFTSGTEGSPKAVVLSGRNVVANAMQAEARISIGKDDLLLNVLPAFHSFGLTGGIVLPLVAGVRLYLYPSPLHYKQIPEVAAKLRPTIMFGTDSFLVGYARTAKNDDFSSLRFVVAGAEPVKADTRQVWRDRFGAEIIEGYGLTEAAPVVSVNTATHSRDGTVGRLLPGMKMRLEPVEGIAQGGQLQLQGPNLMLGYINPESPGVLQPLGEGWHDTGDIVTVDREGFITIAGRARRFAKIAGEMVSLGAVEALAHALWPEEQHAAVAVPDKRRGERVVLVTTAGEADASQLRQFAKASEASELILPHDIIKTAELPRLGTGKIDYGAVRRLAIEQLGSGEAAA